MSRLVPPYIETLSPYVPGKPIEEVEREYGTPDVLKLASNENALGVSPLALAAAKKALPRAYLYPDGSAFYLKGALARKLGVAPEEIIVGNGSNDIIELLIRTFLVDGDEALTSEGTFVIYRLAVQAQGRRCQLAPMTRERRYDLPGILSRIGPRTKLVFLANPDNPTGTHFTRAELEAFLPKVPPETLVVLDEAYFEFVTADDYPDSMRYRQRHPNLITLRTYSKIYGMAGFRLGYGVAQAQLIEYLNRVRAPFNVNSVALAAGVAALEDEEHVRRSRELMAKEIPFVSKELTRLGAKVLPSQTNFVFADFPGRPAPALFEALLRKGVIVRPMHGYGFQSGQRITVAGRKENERLVRTVGEVLQS
jgi:histidinol-phosphate aminotransferase